VGGGGGGVGENDGLGGEMVEELEGVRGGGGANASLIFFSAKEYIYFNSKMKPSPLFVYKQYV